MKVEQRFGDYVNNALEHHSVKDWILLYPDYIYQRVYCHKRFKLKPLELSKECIDILKKQLSLFHPDLLVEIEKRKDRHITKAIVGINLKK